MVFASKAVLTVDLPRLLSRGPIDGYRAEPLVPAVLAHRQGNGGLPVNAANVASNESDGLPSVCDIAPPQVKRPGSRRMTGKLREKGDPVHRATPSTAIAPFSPR